MKNGEIWKDNNGIHINAHGGHIIFYNEEFYWYGEHKIEGWNGRLAWHGVHAYRSSDLEHWTDCGIVLPVVDDPLSPIHKGCRIERPKVIFCKKTGCFVMYFHSTDENHTLARCGIAVADNPLGVFNFFYAERPEKGHWPLDVTSEDYNPESIAHCPAEAEIRNGISDIVINSNILGRDFANGQMARDMTLFVDDDQTVYHIYASEHNSTLHISRLADDYLTHEGTYTRAFNSRWLEAPVMFKKNGKYYLMMSGCTSWKPNAAVGAFADNVFGPWTEFGNPCEGFDSDSGNGLEVSFGGQGACAFSHRGDVAIMLDRWNPDNFIDSRYIWLPVVFKKDGTYKVPYIKEYSC